MYLGYTCKVCIIDNTNLAVYSGSGEKAVFSNEMICFTINYSFKWKAHNIGHANRKAGKERNFYTIETNFLPGRTFADFDDLNKQALDWAFNRYAKRPMSITKLIPLELFEIEKPYLIKLDKDIMAPYQCHKRLIDQYGYIVINANYYWIPKEVNGLKITEREITAVEYPDKLSIFKRLGHVISYPIAPFWKKGLQIFPDNMKGKIFSPKNITKQSIEEELKLRKMSDKISIYIDFILSKECKLPQKNKFIRDLYCLSKKINASLFIECIDRAYKYKIYNLISIERIALQLLKNNCPAMTLLMDYKDDYQERSTYVEGLYSEESDLKNYQNIMEKKED
jgi:hypothetical protein